MRTALRQPADYELVQGVLAERPDAVETFLQRVRCVGPILNAQNSRMGRPLDNDDLADLIQDTLVVVWKKLATFAGQASLETWLYRMCCLELLSFLRRKGKRNELTMGLIEVVQPTANHASQHDQSSKNEVLISLRQLARREAEIVRLKHFEELTFREIASVLDLSVSTTKTHYYRGLAKMRSVLLSRGKGVSRDKSTPA